MLPFNVQAAAFLFVLCFGCRAQPAEDHGARIERYLSELQAHGQFNGTVLIYEAGRVIHRSAFGIRRMDPVDSLTIHSQFRLASVSKQFTAMAIMLLKEDGRLQYDQDIRDFLPELSYPGITIRHLLHHVSGLPDYEPLMDQHWKTDLRYDDPMRYTDGNADLLRSYADLKPAVLFSPGAAFKYSNTGYNLLGTIVTRASGVSFAQFLKERVFEPAGMHHTVLYDFVIGDDPKMPNRAYGLQAGWNDTDLSPSDSHYLNHGQGEDGVYSTVDDLLKWDRILYTEKLVSKATLKEAFTPGVLTNGMPTDYGFGWYIQQTPTGRPLVQHSGSWLSFSTYIFRAVEEDKCFVLLMNHSHGEFWDIVNGLTNILYDQPYALPPLSVRRMMGREVFEHGVEHAMAQYKKIKAERLSEYAFHEQALNILGYELLWAGRVDDAVAILKLNTEEYPGSANVYDSYGDALLAKGDTANALVNFKKCLVLDESITATKEKIAGIEKAQVPSSK